jgi:tRNA(fMet)-specific endonuclease VapC
VRYLIDTTVLIPYFAGDQDARNLIKRLLPDGVAASILAYLEAYQGVIECSEPVDARRKFDAFFDDVSILPISPAVARRCAELRSPLKRQGKNPRRRAFDLVIAATALEHDLALVTHNVHDYRDIPGLARLDPRA